MIPAYTASVVAVTYLVMVGILGLATDTFAFNVAKQLRSSPLIIHVFSCGSACCQFVFHIAFIILSSSGLKLPLHTP